MPNKHIGGDFDSFLEQENILVESEALALKRIIAFALKKTMKKLIALISPVGKSKEQLVDEAYEAMQKYFKVEKEVLADVEKEQAPRKSAEELMVEYRAKPERETLQQEQEEAFVSLRFNKKNDKK